MSYWLAILVLPPVLSVVPVPAARMTAPSLSRARNRKALSNVLGSAAAGIVSVIVPGAAIEALTIWPRSVLASVASAVIWRRPVSVPAARSWAITGPG